MARSSYRSSKRQKELAKKEKKERKRQKKLDQKNSAGSVNPEAADGVDTPEAVEGPHDTPFAEGSL